MVLKGLPREYNMFTTVVVQKEKQMTFAKFKSALRSLPARGKHHDDRAKVRGKLF